MTSSLLALLLAASRIPQIPSEGSFGDQFAVAIAAGHDLNGDGVPDLVISDGTDLRQSTVWLVSGRDGIVLARHLAPGNISDVDFLGDIDRDGTSEVGVVSSTWEGTDFLEVLSGKDASTIRITSPDQLGVRRLCGVRAAGSVDADGCPDLLVGCAVPQDANRMLGAVLVLSGKDGHVIWKWIDDRVPWRVVDGRSSCYAGMSFVSIGDVDSDDSADIAVSDFGFERRHLQGAPPIARVVVYSGGTGKPLFELRGNEKEPDFGFSLDGGIDFDGDLRPEILVGSPDVYCGFRVPGRVRVYSGRDGSLLFSIDRAQLPERRFDNDSFGENARFLGDLDGDGHPDLLIGAPEDGLSEGTAYVASGLDGRALYTVEGHCGMPKPGEPDRGDRYVGRTLARAGDIDRDGVEDFVVGNCPNDRGQFGLVRIFSGKTGKLLLSVDRESLLIQKQRGPAPR